MTEYRKGRPEEKDLLIDLGNYVFSHDGGRTDFPSLQPKLYGPQVNTSEEHYVAFRDGKPVAMIGAFDIPLVINGCTIKMRGIGTVAVHPYHRGEGHMKKLMAMAIEDMQKDGVQISFLGGQRQRYRYFGYEICGEMLHFDLTQTNLRHDCKDLNTDDITFGDLKDPEEIKKALALYKQEPIHRARTTDDFVVIASSCYHKVKAIYQNEEFCGYYAASSNGDHIGEICLNPGISILKVLAAHLRQYEDTWNVSFSLTPMRTEWIAELEAICEGYSVGAMEMFRVFDFETVLRELMQIKSRYVKLMDGEMIVAIDNGEQLRIAVENGVSTVEKTTLPPQATFTAVEAVRFFFSPVKRYINFGVQSPCASCWFPLPLSFSHQESV